eukprot:scaffold297_cov171-Amphora_coffeaeformis.AAC.20
MRERFFVTQSLVVGSKDPSIPSAKGCLVSISTPGGQFCDETVQRATSCQALNNAELASPHAQVNKLPQLSWNGEKIDPTIVDTPSQSSKLGLITKLFQSRHRLVQDKQSFSSSSSSSFDVKELPPLIGHNDTANNSTISSNIIPKGIKPQSPPNEDQVTTTTPTRIGAKSNTRPYLKGGREELTTTHIPASLSTMRILERNRFLTNRNSTPERSRRQVMREQAKQRHELRREVSKTLIDEGSKSQTTTMVSRRGDEWREEKCQVQALSQSERRRPEQRSRQSPVDDSRRWQNGMPRPNDKHRPDQGSERRVACYHQSMRNLSHPRRHRQKNSSSSSKLSNASCASLDSVDSERSMTFSKTVVGQLLAQEGIQAEKDFEVNALSKKKLMDERDNVQVDAETVRTQDTSALTSTDDLESSVKEGCPNSSLSSKYDSSSELSVGIDAKKIRKFEKRRDKCKMTKNIRALDAKLNLALNAILSAQAQLEKLKLLADDDSDSEVSLDSSSNSSSDISSTASFSVQELLHNSNKFLSTSKASLQGNRISVV